jgi:hypothetical protein
MRTWRIVLVCGAAAMVAVGFFLGGFDAVWRKASMVCLECIGLG